MPTTAVTERWPSCPTCEQPYTVTLGVPVVLSAARTGTRWVDATIDPEFSLDDSATISCGCGTEDEWAEGVYVAAVALLEPALEALASAQQVTATYDLTDRG